MQQSAFIAHCPYEVGDKVNITFYEGAAVIGGPVTAKTAEVIITDILAVHSFKRQQVTFMYEINNTKVLQLVEWEAVKHGK